MDDVLYEVRITGLALARFSHEHITATFAELFCLSPVEASLRLSALPLVVRGSLSREQAAKYQRVLARSGMECEIRMQGAAGTPPGPGERPVGESA